MNKDQKFYLCKHCGNLIGMINDSGVNPVCCGEKMTLLVPNTVEASNEKHLPVISIDGNIVTVKVGSVPHPMLAEHFIQWIYLQTKNGGQRRALLPGQEPVAKFAIVDDEVVAAFEYCNLHGLWKTELN